MKLGTILNPSLFVLLLLAGTAVREAQAKDFCNAYDSGFLGDVDEPVGGTTGLSADKVAEEMGLGLSYAANLLGIIPGMGFVSAIVGMASDMYQDRQANEAMAALANYVDAVDKNNKISDLQTEWETTLSNLVSAMKSIDDDDDDAPDDTKLINSAGLCHDFFGYSGGGTTWGGVLSETSVDYSVFGATQRLLYAPSMCNQCIALHSTRYITYNRQYEVEADAIGKPASAAVKTKRDSALEDLRFTAGRCLVDVLPMAMDAAQEEGDAAKDYDQKLIVGVSTRWYAGVDEYNGGRYFEFDQTSKYDDGDVQDFFDQCRADMHKNIGDWWMEWYRQRLFIFQRDWAYLSAFASPNGLVMMDPPTATFDLDRTYTIMNEAYGAFLNPTPYYAVNVLNFEEDKPASTTDPFDHIGTISNRKESYIYADSTSGNYYLQETTIPIGWVDVPGYVITDKETGQILCVLDGYRDNFAYFTTDTADNKESWCVWQFENVEADTTSTSLRDSTYDATTVYVKNLEGTYLTADTTFMTLWQPFGIAAKGSNSPSDYATWRILRTPNFDTANYAEVFECDDSSDCDSSQICDSAAHFCTDPPELAVGEKCESDEECKSGVCQSLEYSVDRCAESWDVGSLLTICESEDYSDGTKCDTGLSCIMETPSYGLCKKPDYGLDCMVDDYCASGICNTLLVTSQCDTVEPMSYGALCESDDHCDGIMVCGSDNFCEFADGPMVLSQMTGSYAAHQAAAEACGGSLITISDEDTNVAAKALMAKYGFNIYGKYSFIGLHKSLETDYKWAWEGGSEVSYTTFSSNGSKSGTRFVYLYCAKDSLDYCEWYAGDSYLSNRGSYFGMYRLPEGYEQIDGCNTLVLSE